MPNVMIGSVSVEPAIARPGESIRVEVLAPEDKPMEGTGAQVSINGVPGAVQFLQFPTEGERRISVRAVGAPGSEREVVTVNVTGEPLTFTGSNGTADTAMIGVTQSSASPYTAVLTLGSFIDARAVTPLHPSHSIANGLQYLVGKELTTALKTSSKLEELLTQNARGAARIEQLSASAFRAPRVSGASNRSARRAMASKAKPSRMIATVFDMQSVDMVDITDKLGMANRTYEWDFGDGKTQTTRTPTVSRDFFAGIDHANGMGVFHVTCRVPQSNIEVKRTLTIQSAYNICKRAGAIVPHTTGDIFATKQFTMITGTFIVHNVEEQPLVLNRVSVSPTSEDLDAKAVPNSFRPLGNTITIAPHSSSAISVNIPFVKESPDNGELRYDVHGFTVIYAGSSNDMPVRCSYTFDIPVGQWDDQPHLPNFDLPPLHRKPWPWEMVEDFWEKINPGEEAVNPGDVLINPADILLDKVTGTIAISLGSIAAKTSAVKVQNALTNVLSAVYAPLQTQALEAGELAQPMSSNFRRKARSNTEGISTLRFGGTEVAKSAKTMENLARKILGIGTTMQTMEGELPEPPPAGPVAEGEVCTPDNLTEEDLAQAEEAQLVCQLTDEVQDVLMPARWMNARKGDIILSPGGTGIIGGLMLRVNPPQWYSHSGIMTRNYEEITHSTGSEKRLKDHQIGVLADGTDGFEPSVLKYMWPGAIRQSVEASVDGEYFPDPEYNKNYKITAFGKQTVGVTHNDQMVMIPPLVVKPDPLLETPAIRTTLHTIATDCANDAGRPGITSKYHYRFYCYTDPSIGLGAPEGIGAGWAMGTRPSVCSSFIWMKAEGRATNLETTSSLVMPNDLEPNDIAKGAAVRPITPDGLYTYSAEERLNAGEWLYDHIYNQAYEVAGWAGTALTDAPDDVANQFLNAFENDDADGKDSDEWRTPEPADAVSPDDMLWWDGPDKGGVYGFVEPAIYRERRVESFTVSRWKKVVTRGDIRGRVFANGDVTSGALVQVYESKSAFSAADGTYNIADVPLGSYMLKASKVIDGALHSVQQNIELTGEDMTVDIVLQPPDERNRLAQITIDFRGVDEENWPESDEIHDPSPEYFELELSPSQLTNSTNRSFQWGGEVRMEYTITAKLLVGNSIDIVVNGVMYEGTSEDNDDLDGQGSTSFQVGLNENRGATLVIKNTDEDDDDEGKLSILVKNARNDN
jgi:hypothetical protein